MATFNPYAKGIPVRKESKPRIVEKPVIQDSREKARQLEADKKLAQRDLLDGLEGNYRRQYGWGEDDGKNELCDGIAITPISKAALKKKIASQQKGGFAAK